MNSMQMDRGFTIKRNNLVIWVWLFICSWLFSWLFLFRMSQVIKLFLFLNLIFPELIILGELFLNGQEVLIKGKLIQRILFILHTFLPILSTELLIPQISRQLIKRRIYIFHWVGVLVDGLWDEFVDIGAVYFLS